MAVRTDGLLSETIAATGSTVDTVVCQGPFEYVVSGSWTGTVTLDKSYDGGSTWLVVHTQTANEDMREGWERSKRRVQYRFTFTKTTGSAVVDLRCGNELGYQIS